MATNWVRRRAFPLEHRWGPVCTRRYSTAADAFKVLFFGRDEFSCLVMQSLLEAKDVWQDIQVVTQPDTKTGRRGSNLSISPLKCLAQEVGLSVHTIPHERSAFKTWKAPFPFEQELPAQPPHQHLLVTASFGRILPNTLLNLFLPSRRVNVHPSLVPAYRGASPIQYAIMDGLKETGVSVLEMTERKRGIDSGAIWATERLPVPDDATFPTLRDSLGQAGGQLLVSVLRGMLAGKDTRKPQDHNPNAPRAPLITADDSMLDFRSMDAAHIVLRHRAISHQKPLTTLLKTQRTLQLHDPSLLTDVDPELRCRLAEPGHALYHPPTRALVIRCAEDTYIAVPRVRQQDRSLLKAKEWWNGAKPEMFVSSDPSGPLELCSFHSV